MTEAAAISIARADAPRTRARIAEDLRRLGLKEGAVALVHSSLSRLGWVCGGPVAVLQALQDVLGPEGTLVMPAHSGEYSDPAAWQNPPVPESWWQTIRDTMPAFDPAYTPTRGMGRIAETFRSWPGVRRSYHPSVSFTAAGRHAEFITANHSLDFPLGEDSPLGRVYELDGVVLLLGVGYDSCTSFHLAEFLAPNPREVIRGAPVFENGERVWKTYRDIDGTIEMKPNVWTNPFMEIGSEMEESGQVVIGKVGSAKTRLFSQRVAVDAAVEQMTALRNVTAKEKRL